MGSRANVTKEDFIQKLKDDGHFDELRLKFVRTLRDKEDLRSSIISLVKQSEALNCPANENLKPRQFCDAIYKEIEVEAMNQISGKLMEVIKSDDGTTEITKTLQSVFKKLVNPKGDEEGNSSSFDILAGPKTGTGKDSFPKPAASEMIDQMSDNELNEPPGFSLNDTHQNKSHGEQKGEQQQHLMSSERGSAVEQKEESDHPLDVSEPRDVAHGVAPGFSASMGKMQLPDCSDEDPDVPPGFG